MFKTQKTKNGYNIELKGNTIIVSKDNKVIQKQAFSDALKAQVAFNNL